MGCPDRVGKCPLGLDDDEIHTVFKSSVSRVRLNRGGVRWGSAAATLKMREKGLTAENAGGCAYHAIVYPNPRIIEEFKPIALQILDPNIAVLSLHRRTGEWIVSLVWWWISVGWVFVG